MDPVSWPSLSHSFSWAKLSKGIHITVLFLIAYNVRRVCDDLVTQVTQGLVTELNILVFKCGTNGSRGSYIWHWK